MLATTVIALLVGVLLSAAIVKTLARRCRLPIRETLMWFGLAELDGPALTRAERSERR